MKKLIAALLLFALSPMAHATFLGETPQAPIHTTYYGGANHPAAVAEIAKFAAGGYYGCPGTQCSLFFGPNKVFEVGDFIYTKVDIRNNTTCQVHHWDVTLKVESVHGELASFYVVVDVDYINSVCTTNLPPMQCNNGQQW